MRCNGALAVLALGLCGVPLSAGNIVVNGSFELPQISGNFYQTILAGDPTITGWTVGGQSVDIVQGAGWSQLGTQGIDMVGTPFAGTLSQTLPTSAGFNYLVSFWVSSNGAAKSQSLTVQWNGSDLATVDSPAQNTWTQFEYNVLGAGSDTLSFIGSDIPGSPQAGALLDNVSVQETPEPASMGLIGAGLVILAGFIKRRSRAA
jgi:hypothetical protein